MTTTTTSDGHLDPQALSATQRSRWATQRKSVNSSNNKRNSLLERMGHKKTGSNEKNPPPTDPTLTVTMANRPKRTPKT
ncbi:phospholipid transporting ATPase [Fusarium oxysporum]|nr:phospholipid transporting ATPase [Fusarium oxysporum]